MANAKKDQTAGQSTAVSSLYDKDSPAPAGEFV